MVFGLMLDGCLSGAFSDRYLRDAGHFKLFVYVMKSVLIRPRWMSRGPVMVQTYLLCSNKREVGFIQLDSSASTAESAVSTIVLFAIAKADQNQGLGTNTVLALIAALPQNAILDAYCTKYARSMQHVLAKLHFSRDKSTIDNLTRFSYQKL